MATFAIKVGPSLMSTPETTFTSQTEAMNYARAYALANNLFPAIIGSSLTNFIWKYNHT